MIGLSRIPDRILKQLIQLVHQLKGVVRGSRRLSGQFGNPPRPHNTATAIHYPTPPGTRRNLTPPHRRLNQTHPLPAGPHRHVTNTAKQLNSTTTKIKHQHNTNVTANTIRIEESEHQDRRRVTGAVNKGLSAVAWLTLWVQPVAVAIGVRHIKMARQTLSEASKPCCRSVQCARASPQILVQTINVR